MLLFLTILFTSVLWAFPCVYVSVWCSSFLYKSLYNVTHYSYIANKYDTEWKWNKTQRNYIFPILFYLFYEMVIIDKWKKGISGWLKIIPCFLYVNITTSKTSYTNWIFTVSCFLPRLHSCNMKMNFQSEQDSRMPCIIIDNKILQAFVSLFVCQRL